jgi:hypothetical protein
MIGDITFFTCRRDDCGAPMTVTRHATVPTQVELACGNGHLFSVQPTAEGGLILRDR